MPAESHQRHEAERRIDLRTCDSRTGFPEQGFVLLREPAEAPDDGVAEVAAASRHRRGIGEVLLHQWPSAAGFVPPQRLADDRDDVGAQQSLAERPQQRLQTLVLDVEPAAREVMLERSAPAQSWHLDRLALLVDVEVEVERLDHEVEQLEEGRRRGGAHCSAPRLA
ncbi:MAG: hypothetical protein WAT39_12915 [Planctomycetota bacterium]